MQLFYLLQMLSIFACQLLSKFRIIILHSIKCLRRNILKVVDLLEGRGALAWLLNLALEGNGHGPQLGHLLAGVGLLHVEVGKTALGKAGEANVLGDGLASNDLAGGAALGDGGLGNADLSLALDDNVLQDTALTGLGLQGLGDLFKRG